MQLNTKTLETLRVLINEGIEYKSGPKLVDFFNQFGFTDSYGGGFPSRWAYTDSKLFEINNSSQMHECLLQVFNPINFLPDLSVLDEHIKQFNIYLEFDGYKISRHTKRIEIVPLIPSTILENNISFDEAHIHEQWTKAIERKSSDPEGAITIARTLIESVLKHILSEQNIHYNENMDLSELYKEVAKNLNLAPEQHQEPIFKQILGGANGIISGLGTLRNKLGDAHGSNKAKSKPKERHSELAVNMSGSIAIFLYKTFLEHKEQK